MFVQQISILEKSLFRLVLFELSSHMSYLKSLILNSEVFSFQFVASILQCVKEVSRDKIRKSFISTVFIMLYLFKLYYFFDLCHV